MSDNKELFCMSCMNPVPAGSSCCPVCGYDGTQQNPAGLLPIGSRLQQGSFIVGRVIKVNAYSVDYTGYDVKQLTPCDIREYMPAGGAVRAAGETQMKPVSNAVDKYKKGLASFINTYRKLAWTGESSALPKQFAFFQENGTAYCTSERFEGMTLRELLKKNGGTLSEAQTCIVMAPVLKALEYLHNNDLVHGGVCPESILINRNGDVRLTGFGAEEDSDSQGLLGYMAPEVYAGEEIGVRADIYSVGAVFYRCLTGIVPQDAAQRKTMDTLTPPADISEDISEGVSSAVWNALLLETSLRTRNIHELRTELEKAVVIPEDPAEDEKTEEQLLESKRRYRWQVILVISFVTFMVMLTVFFIGRDIREKALRREQERQRRDPVAEKTVEVPDYVGERLADISFDTYNFDYLIVNTYNDGPVDVVTGQSPSSGMEVGESDRLITLYVNREKDARLCIENYLGKDGLEVTERLKELGIEYEIIYEKADDKEPGIVLAQNPAPGESLEKDGVLILAISQKW